MKSAQLFNVTDWAVIVTVLLNSVSPTLRRWRTTVPRSQ